MGEIDSHEYHVYCNICLSSPHLRFSAELAGTTLWLKELAVGDVWFCAGQHKLHIPVAKVNL